MNKMMRFACMMLVFLFSAWLSILHAHQDGQANIGVNATSSSRKEKTTGEVARTAAMDSKIGGRKMAPTASINVKENGAIGGTTTKTSKIKQFEKGCESQRKAKVMNSSCEENSSHQKFEEVDEETGFVAFNADYHAPRHHPPKNN